MIISRTPFRVSFFGGGTDYPAYFLNHGGATLVTAINKFITITVQPLTSFLDHALQVHYSKVEAVGSLDEIQLPVVREVLRHLNIGEGVEIHLAADLPARTGLGTSSAAAVGLLTALYAHKGKIADPVKVAAEAVYIEQELMKERVGCQDQYACSVGGFQHLTFRRDGNVDARPVTVGPVRLNELERHLMMFYTGLRRTAHDIVETQVRKTSEGHLDQFLERMHSQVFDGMEILTSGNLCDFGDLLHEAWTLKRQLSSAISNPAFDDLYARARAAGARGGKLLGAGAGGFFLFFVEPEHQASVRAALSDLREVSFGFERQGSRIIFYQP